jgi:hypothetical protein
VPIEFHCTHCQKLLKTADDKAGVRARCPGCGGAIVVPPAADAVFTAEFAGEPDGPEQETVGAVDPPVAVAPAAAADMKPCPVCRELIRAAATRCRYCGEILDREPGAAFAVDAPVHRGPFAASDALSSAWTIFQTKVGVLVLASFLATVVQTVMLIGAYLLAMLVGLLAQGGLHGAGGGDFDGESVLVVVTVVCAWFLIFMPVQAFLQGGFRRMLLNAALGQPVAIEQLFSGGRWTLRLLGANFLMLLMVVAGTILAFVPAVFAVLVFWPYSFVLVDTDCGAFDSFQRS